jgi:N-acetylmuramic acid 6-phosphate (MurNAc-6-P) etherase
VTATLNTEEGTTVAFNGEKQEMTISYADKKFTVVRELGKATVKDAEGNVLAYATAGENGTMNITDASGKVLSSYSMDEVNTMLANR